MSASLTLTPAFRVSDLDCRLKLAEIIPTVFDTFTPAFTLSIFWENATAEVGNTVNPARVQKRPDVKFIDDVPEVSSLTGGVLRDESLVNLKKGMQLTLALTDPDAPSRDNPEWSQICHWIATDVKVTDPSSSSSSSPFKVSGSSEWKEIMPYKPPGPPPKTGKHRYVFVALAPANGTTASLNLSKPGDRQHWGYKHERQGLRKWAEENGLVVVGANFIYAQNDEQ